MNCDGLLLFFFMCSHEHNFLLMHRLCVCLLWTGSFNTSRQSIVRGAMFGPVSLLKDALHRAVRAKSGEVNKTKPTVPPYLLLFFFLPTDFFFFFIIMIFFPSVLSSSQHPWASSVIRTQTNNCFLSDLFGSSNKTKTKKKTHHINSA